jgi:ATP phosphoribosyltransferase
MIRLAVQKSGRLNEDSLKLLKDCGISIDNGKDQLKAAARNFPMEVFSYAMVTFPNTFVMV